MTNPLTKTNLMLSVGIALGAVIYTGFVKPYADKVA